MCTPAIATLALVLAPPTSSQVPAESGSGRPHEPAAEDAAPAGLSASDWDCIRAAHAAGRHAVHPADDGYSAHNPGQQWRIRFDGRGFSTRPEAGGWTWGLDLRSFGFAGSELVLRGSARTSAEAQCVAYDWDASLQEWYVNDPRGLEHGYTVHQRPSAHGERIERGPLIFTLAVRGALRPEVTGDGGSVRFLDENGAAVVTYTGLSAFDAGGQALDASFERTGSGLRLSVDERSARYPLTIDPIAQQAYLKASNTGLVEWFGWPVSVSGDTVVVGAMGEDSSATGVNGDQSDDSAPFSGAAYVFVRNGASWSQQAYLKASNTDAGDSFGTSVSVSGDTVVVGAEDEASSSTGVNGDQDDNSVPGGGAAYVFARSGTDWSQQAYLKASNTDPGDQFGSSVAVSEDTVVVGAWQEASSASGVNGDQDDNSASFAGAAYVFARNGTSWTQQAYLKASNTDGGDWFGRSVAVSGDTVVVGAEHEASSAIGVNGDQSDNSAVNAGAAYVFVRSGTSWSQEAYLKASNTEGLPFNDSFGESVSVSGDTVVVGASFEDSNATVVNGAQSDNSATNAGAAYVFVRSAASWGQQAYLKASNTDAHDRFGTSVALSSDTLVVGAFGEGSNATGVNGDPSDNSATGSGAAYVFVRSAASWSQQAYLKASNTDASDSFGSSVAVAGDTAVAGAPFEDSSATGVNGDQSDNSANISGAAYVFDTSGTPVFYCTPKTSSSACVTSIWTSDLTAQPISGANDYFVTASQVQETQNGLLFAGISGPSNIPFNGGTLCVQPPTERGPVMYSGGVNASGCNGAFSTLVNDGTVFPGGLDAGMGNSGWYQYWYRDRQSGAGELGTALSNAVQLDFQ